MSDDVDEKLLEAIRVALAAHPFVNAKATAVFVLGFTAGWRARADELETKGESE